MLNYTVMSINFGVKVVTTLQFEEFIRMISSRWDFKPWDDPGCRVQCVTLDRSTKVPFCSFRFSSLKYNSAEIDHRNWGKPTHVVLSDCTKCRPWTLLGTWLGEQRSPRHTAVSPVRPRLSRRICLHYCRCPECLNGQWWLKSLWYERSIKLPAVLDVVCSADLLSSGIRRPQRIRQRPQLQQQQQ